jgi:hypothetical protein
MPVIAPTKPTWGDDSTLDIITKINELDKKTREADAGFSVIGQQRKGTGLGDAKFHSLLLRSQVTQ